MICSKFNVLLKGILCTLGKLRLKLCSPKLLETSVLFRMFSLALLITGNLNRNL